MELILVLAGSSATVFENALREHLVGLVLRATSCNQSTMASTYLRLGSGSSRFAKDRVGCIPPIVCTHRR
jgi:hypothetical protein